MTTNASTQAPAAGEAAIVRGELYRITAERGAWFAGILIQEGGERVSFTGSSAILPPVGSELEVTGTWQDRGNYGLQVKGERITYSNPTTRDGAVRVLQTLPGIGEHRARQLVDALGPETAIAKLLADPDQLARIPGIGKRGADAVRQLREQKALFQAESALAELGLGSALRARIIEEWGGPERTMEILQTNPYRLVEIDRVSFRKVDDNLLATQRFPPDSPFRATAAIVEALKEEGSNGHTWTPRPLIADALNRLKLPVPVPTDVIEKALETSSRKGQIRLLHGADADAEPGYAAPKIAADEELVASYFARLLEAPPLPIGGQLSQATRDTLTDEQARAVELISTGNLLVLTGGPGTGKTFTTRAILEALGTRGTLIAAPTGKAAKRAKELTEADAATIHRLAYQLQNKAAAIREGELDPSTWPRAIIIDEASMLSVDVAALLLSSLDPGDMSFPLVRVVLVGDIDQLPPIGPGAILRDCLATPAIPSVRLTKIHRQAEGSAIVTNAHRIIRGEKPEDPKPAQPGAKRDWYTILVDKGENERLASQIVELHKRTAAVFGIDPREIMVLSPQRAGAVGINAINAALRQILNPPTGDPTEPQITLPYVARGAAKDSAKPTLRRGDRVIVTANNYQLGVVNGDLGTIGDVIPGGGRRDDKGKLVEDRLVVEIDGTGPVTFAGDAIFTLQHAYCLSVHKSQGSEYQAVIAVASSSHMIMLGRSLLYTAVTRAREILVLAGDRPGLAMALRDRNEETRRTRLASLMAGKTHQEPAA